MKARLAKKILKRAEVLDLRRGDVLLVRGLNSHELQSAHELFRSLGVTVVGAPQRMRVSIVAPPKAPFAPAEANA